MAAWVLLVACGPAATTAPPSAGGTGQTCDLEEELDRVAGDHPVDCGRVGVGEDPSAAEICTVEAWRNGQPFVAVFEEPGIDSQLAMGLAGDGVAVRTLWFDSDPSGGSDVGASVSGCACVDPFVDADPDDAHELLSCGERTGCEEVCDEAAARSATRGSDARRP